MKFLRYVLPLSLFAGSITVSAQGPVQGLCGCPPCAPGFAQHSTQGGVTVVRVKCYNTSVFDCYSVTMEKGVLAPNKIKVGDKGKLTVNDANGKPVGAQTMVTYTGEQREVDGSVTHSFTKN